MMDLRASIPALPHPVRGPSVMAAPGLDDSPHLAALRDLALAGDDAAWGELYELYNHRVVVALLGRGCSLQRARELAQSAWERVIKKARAGHLETLKLPGLVIREATFRALDAWRSEARMARCDSPDALDQVADPQADPEHRSLSRQRLALALARLETLSPRARQIFLSHHQHGLPAEVVATELGISTQRVRQTLCEVRKALREAIEDEA